MGSHEIGGVGRTRRNPGETQEKQAMEMVTVVQMEQSDSHHVPSKLSHPASACPPLIRIIPRPLPSPSLL